MIDVVPVSHDQTRDREGLHDAQQKRNIPAPNRKTAVRRNNFLASPEKSVQPEKVIIKQTVQLPPKKLTDMDDIAQDIRKNEIKDSTEQEDLKVPLFRDQVNGNYEVPVAKREGPGENGVAYRLPASEQKQAQAGNHEYGFNQLASDKISLDRIIPDTRPDE